MAEIQYSVKLKKKHEKRFVFGHDWIFSNELEPDFKTIPVGELVLIYRSNDNFLGIGIINPNSLITVRCITRKKEPIDKHFFKKKIELALSLRLKLIESSNSYRLIYSESDGIPGLLVDSYANVLSVQINSAGMEKFKDLIIECLDEVLNPKAIVIRNDHHHRKMEQLPEEKYIAKGIEENAQIEMLEHDIVYKANILEGQKTGFYLDQRDNRRWFRSLIDERSRVFDGFCNEGGFALNAKKAGAKEVIAVDMMEHVLERAKENAKLNHLEIDFIQADLMETHLNTDEYGLFDVVNLDPPNFTRNRKTVNTALRGYEKMHRFGIKLTKNQGYLTTASCSHHIEEGNFIETVKNAAYKEKRQVQLIHSSFHAADHPIHPSMPETSYLKFYAFRVI